MQAKNQLYNLAPLELIANGDRSFVVKMVAIFLDATPKDCTNLVNACANKDWQTVHNVAHKMKSSINGMGITCLRQNIKDVEALSTNNIDALHDAEITILIKHIENILHQCFLQLKAEFSL